MQWTGDPVLDIDCQQRSLYAQCLLRGWRPRAPADAVRKVPVGVLQSGAVSQWWGRSIDEDDSQCTVPQEGANFSPSTRLSLRASRIQRLANQSSNLLHAAAPFATRFEEYGSEHFYKQLKYFIHVLKTEN